MNEDVPCENFNIIDVQDEIEHEDDKSNATFMNPSQIDELLSDNMFKCEICDFTSSSKNFIIDHKEEIHNWCRKCYSSFKSKEKLKNHIKKKHTEKPKLTGLTS